MDTMKRMRERLYENYYESTGESRLVGDGSLAGVTLWDPKKNKPVGFVSINRYYEEQNKRLAAEKIRDELADLIRESAPATWALGGWEDGSVDNAVEWEKKAEQLLKEIESGNKTKD